MGSQGTCDGAWSTGVVENTDGSLAAFECRGGILEVDADPVDVLEEEGCNVFDEVTLPLVLSVFRDK
jgi:hypothetical protein